MSGVVSHLLNFEQVRQHIIVRREWLYRPLRSIADRRTALFWDDRWETFERRRASEEEEEDHHHQLNDTYLVRLSLEGFWVTVTQHSTIPPQEEEKKEELEEREPTSQQQQMGTFLLPFASIESMAFDYLTSPGSPSRICFLFKSGCYLDRSGILTPPVDEENNSSSASDLPPLLYADAIPKCFDNLDDPWRPERLAMNFRCEADRLRLLNTLLIACQVDYRESPRPVDGVGFTVALLSEPLLGMVDRRRPPLVLESPQWVQEVGLEVPLRLLLETGKEDDLLEAIDQIKLKKEK